MPTIGLTGGIASGKSTAARMLAELGAAVIDADLLGHRAYEPGSPGFAKVVEAFGSEIVGDDGRIDRAALGARVFGKPEAMERLTSIVWPEIRALAVAEMDALRAEDPGRWIVLEAAVLLEAGWEDLVQQVWVVSTDEESAVARLASRNGLSREQALERIRSQLSREEREARADRVIPNQGSEAELRERIRAEWQNPPE